MKNNNEQRSGTQIIADLSAYAFDTESLPSEREAKEILAEGKIDTSELKAWAAERLQGVRARQKLNQARAQRLSLAARLKELQESVSSSTSGLRQRVLGKIQVLASSSPETAQVYCRKFEETPDEDLPDLEAELMMLDEWKKDESGK